MIKRPKLILTESGRDVTPELDEVEEEFLRALEECKKSKEYFLIAEAFFKYLESTA